MKIDKINLNILKTLQRDARISNHKLSEHVGLSESACLSRVRKLQKEKYIRNYMARINIAKLQHVEFIVNVALKSQDARRAQEFKLAIQKLPQVTSCHKVAGEFDYVMHFVCRDAREFNRISEELLERDLHIEKMTSQLVIEDTKEFDGYPLECLIGD